MGTPTEQIIAGPTHGRQANESLGLEVGAGTNNTAPPPPNHSALVELAAMPPELCPAVPPRPVLSRDALCALERTGGHTPRVATRYNRGLVDAGAFVSVSPVTPSACLGHLNTGRPALPGISL